MTYLHLVQHHTTTRVVVLASTELDGAQLCLDGTCVGRIIVKLIIAEVEENLREKTPLVSSDHRAGSALRCPMEFNVHASHARVLRADIGHLGVRDLDHFCRVLVDAARVALDRMLSKAGELGWRCVNQSLAHNCFARTYTDA